MDINFSEAEKNAALFLSGATSYILNQFAMLNSELNQYKALLQEKVVENQELQKEIDNLQIELNKISK